MTYNQSLLKADVTDELAKLKKLVSEFDKIKGKLDHPPEAVPFLERGAIGYILHNFYNGCENIFRNIARFFENDLSPKNWHRDLLKRMTIEVPGYRPRVINDDLFRLLDDLRGFRHKFRHSYTFELDWERERLVAQKLPTAHALLKNQITAFLAQIDHL